MVVSYSLQSSTEYHNTLKNSLIEERLETTVTDTGLRKVTEIIITVWTSSCGRQYEDK
jgi:hypothetical protein